MNQKGCRKSCGRFSWRACPAADSFEPMLGRLGTAARMFMWSLGPRYHKNATAGQELSSCVVIEVGVQTSDYNARSSGVDSKSGT